MKIAKTGIIKKKIFPEKFLKFQKKLKFQEVVVTIQSCLFLQVKNLFFKLYLDNSYF